MPHIFHVYKKKILWEDRSLPARNSLCEKRAVMGTYGPKHKRLKPCATRTVIFQRENLNYFMV